MLSIWGKKQAYCGNVSRRDFLKIGSLGAGNRRL
jgi:hypothetical protein